MTIRRARTDEAEALTALATRAKAIWGYSAATLSQWQHALAVSVRKIERQPVWVYETAVPAGATGAAGGPAVLGFHALRLVGPGPHDWELDDLWVEPAHVRRGIGGALMRHAMDLARSLGADTLTIDADPNAEPFYVACGAIRYDVRAAPIAEDAARIRPQLRIDLTTARRVPIA